MDDEDVLRIEELEEDVTALREELAEMLKDLKTAQLNIRIMKSVIDGVEDEVASIKVYNG